MLRKSGNISKKGRLHQFEDEPPEKKLISDADIFIKHLAEKQQNTKVSLEQQLSSKKEFYKATELVSLSNYTAGACSLTDFNKICNQSDEVEKLKSLGLEPDEVEFYLDSQKGQDYLHNKHKNLNKSMLEQRLSHLKAIIQSKKDEKNEFNKKVSQNKQIFSEKPESIETKMLKFALANKADSGIKIPRPIDEIKQIEADFNASISYSQVDIKKIRKKARQLGKQIEETTKIKTAIEPTLKPHKNRTLFTGNSKWDLKEALVEEQKPKNIVNKDKVYSCNPKNFYTIKNGEIVKLNSNQASKSTVVLKELKRISIEEIKKIPRFENYETGQESETLYLKNLPNNLQETDLREIFQREVVSIKIMSGKMRGQAFVQFTSAAFAKEGLEAYNGTILNNKPIIIQFGNRRKL